MDFDDLLLNAVAADAGRRAVLSSYQDRFRYLLVDEFQDTNGVQNELVMMLAAEHRNLCVVGDSDQSIYRFRAADVRNILQFEARFPDAQVILLEQNFRSTQMILDAANAVIAKNASRHAKNLFTEGEQGQKLRLYRAGDEYDEGRWVASELRRLRSEYGLNWNEMAVFYRTNAQSRVLEEEMLRAHVPYRVISGMRFYDRKEIKNAMAYARLIVNGRDEASARRVINEPKRGVGEGAQAKLGSYAAEHGLSFAEAAHHGRAAGLTGRALVGAERFAFILDQLRAMANDLSPREMIDAIVRESGIGDALRAENTDEAYSRLENLGELASAAAQYESLLEFVERVSLVSDADQLDSGDGAISMMTLHVAKGLEFPGVIVTGLEETVFPHRRALVDDDELEEERRLFYVGVTRAMRHLSLSHAWTRAMWGQRVDAVASRFLQEIPAELISDISASLPTRRASLSYDENDGFIGRSTSFTEGRAFGAGTAPPVRSTGAELLGLSVGERVVHDRYGPGVVTRRRGRGRACARERELRRARHQATGPRDDPAATRLAIGESPPQRRWQQAHEDEDVAQNRRAPDHDTLAAQPAQRVVGDLVDARRKGSRGETQRHARAHRPRADDLEAHAGALERLGQGQAESIESGLRARVEIADAPHSNGGGAREHQDPSASLGEEGSAHIGQGGDGPGLVDGDHARAGGGVVLVLALVADRADGHDHEVDLGARALEGGGDGGRGARWILGVKEDGVGLGGAVLVGLARGQLEPPGVPARQDHGVRAGGAELLGEGARDVRAAAQDDHGVGDFAK